MVELAPDLVARARRGDAVAARALVDLYSPRVYALVGRILATSPEAVDDVAQDSFIKVLAHLHHFDPRGPAPLGAWISTIAARTALDSLRKTRRLRALPKEPFHEGSEIASTEVPLDELIDARRLGERVASAMNELAPEHRAALLLRIEHDLEYPEIARALAIDVGTVKSRISRARARLREALEDLRAKTPPPRTLRPTAGSNP
ncbi:MAG: sigma-70 family RNA polymerase sigma factor [Deltaproteobacteria bacterium]|nr:sigma-70 family RNA polymerase sigma factor [Deltaproteobacteria bacterium]